MQVRYLIEGDTATALRRLGLTRRPFGVAQDEERWVITLAVSEGEWLRPHRYAPNTITLCADDGIWSMNGRLVSMDEVTPALTKVEPPRYRLAQAFHEAR